MTYVTGDRCADIITARGRAQNALPFTVRMPGGDQPLGSPGGAAGLGSAGTDTELAAARPERQTPP